MLKHLALKSTLRNQTRLALLALVVLVVLGAHYLTCAALAQNDAYDEETFNGSSYVQHGPGPAYGGGYTDYGQNATGITGRFHATYGQFHAQVDYGRWGSGPSFGTGPLSEAGTGRGARSNFKSSAASSQPMPTQAGKYPSTSR